uniref:Uncharacterized protein n=1 Tax=Odontella aurita TaxID=265563 RepID=A0A7S4MTN5_9STRA|mmetsp:Transcript_31962/g.95718  ORF Transcript_31962/g.95718 Transcript_31962/m.95718 type:complete len:170 (+) Transcript_31962:285-794(+)
MAPSPYGSIEGNDPERGVGNQCSSFARNDDAENRDDRDFNLGESYYLRDNSDGRSKFLRALLPILIAVAIVGGLGYYFLRDFEHLYPDQGGGSAVEDDDRGSAGPVLIEDDAPVSAPAPQSSFKTAVPTSYHALGTSCGANEKCMALGLTGTCCPTVDGVMLGCCGIPQ